ncbi:hypothetical protein D027_3922A, partial [Vibrio parahaemolyticus 861]
MAAQVAI